MRKLSWLFGTLMLAAAACNGGGNGSLPSVATAGFQNVRPASASTIPFWESSFTYNGTTYPYEMVGTDPMTAGGSTSIANQIVPLVITFSNATKFDPSNDIVALSHSPIYTNASYGSVGTTQFGDAVMRSEFWNALVSNNYHVLLASPTIEPAISVTIPAADGYTSTTSGVTSGYIQFAYFMNVVETSAIQKLHLSPTSMTLFATTGVKLLEQDSNYCCYSGFHNDLSVATSSGSGIFTTVWGPVTSAKSVQVLSHEVAEWLNDPFYTNRVPEWVQPGESACGGEYLEVGDPVTNYTSIVNGYTIQDIAFYSWFARNVPSIGMVPSTGKPGYDLLGKLSSPAVTCGTSPTPSPSPTPSTSVNVNPGAITFTHAGAAFARHVRVSQRHFFGTFAHKVTCKGVVSVRTLDDTGSKGLYVVRPMRAGKCTVKFLGDGSTGTLDVVVKRR